MVSCVEPSISGFVELAAGGLGGRLEVAGLLLGQLDGRRGAAGARRAARPAAVVAAEHAEREHGDDAADGGEREQPAEHVLEPLATAGGAPLGLLALQPLLAALFLFLLPAGHEPAQGSNRAVPLPGIIHTSMQADSRALHNRLRRIEGQVRGLQRMVDEDAYCVDILTQVAAVQTALEQVAVNVLDGHVRHCVADAVAGADEGEAGAKLDELMAAVRRFAKVR